MTESLLIACPHCQTKNHVPRDKLGAGGKCGRCKEPLFTASPLLLTSSNFVAHSQSDLPLLVDFWATWCGPCQQFAPIFTQAARDLEPRLRLGKVDTDAEPQLAGQFGIRSIPTLILFQQGREVARIAGALPLGQLKAWLQQHLPPTT